VRVHDLARRGHALDARELDPFDMSDHGDAHPASLSDRDVISHGARPPR